MKQGMLATKKKGRKKKKNSYLRAFIFMAPVTRNMKVFLIVFLFLPYHWSNLTQKGLSCGGGGELIFLSTSTCFQ